MERCWVEVLRPELDHLVDEELKRVRFGLKVSYFAHDGQKRKSGEPFIVHPIAVAALLGGLKMDADTVIAGLLHDAVEDTDMTFLQLELLFGPVVRRIVEVRRWGSQRRWSDNCHALGFTLLFRSAITPPTSLGRD